MGGIPKTAMNIVAFPLNKMDIKVLRQIIKGGLDKLCEADVVLVGGHSIEDNELKYGLSVTGLIHPNQILTKKNIRPGDQLVLTKPLGTGIINTAIKAGLASSQLIETVTDLMTMLNKNAAQIMRKFPVNACTDITGFGLIGHLAEMVTGSGYGIKLWSEKIPVIEEALEYAKMGLIPAGAYKNRDFRKSMVEISPKVNTALADTLFDPQTSGGLLICVAKESAKALIENLKEQGIKDAAIIGEVLTQPSEKIIIS